MNEVSALPQIPSQYEGNQPIEQKYTEQVGTDLVRTPDADYYSTDEKMLCASMRMPNPEQISKGISVATSIVIGLKSFVEACRDFWTTLKDNFLQHKTEEVMKAQYNELKMQEAA